jgi:flagellar basal-body rod modification protein FlgD
MTEVNGVRAAAAVPAVRKTGAMQELGKDVFLQLLVTQLRYQDPLNPQDNSAFVAQMAQFTALEQLQNANAALGRLLDLQAGAQAPALLGRLVTVLGDSGLVTGVVRAVEFTAGKPWLVLDGGRFGMETLQKVSGGEEDGF